MVPLRSASDLYEAVKHDEREKAHVTGASSPSAAAIVVISCPSQRLAGATLEPVPKKQLEDTAAYGIAERKKRKGKGGSEHGHGGGPSPCECRRARRRSRRGNAAGTASERSGSARSPRRPCVGPTRSGPWTSSARRCAGSRQSSSAESQSAARRRPPRGQALPTAPQSSSPRAAASHRAAVGGADP
jgi:hypothetical protein